MKGNYSSIALFFAIFIIPLLQNKKCPIGLRLNLRRTHLYVKDKINIANAMKNNYTVSALNIIDVFDVTSVSQQAILDNNNLDIYKTIEFCCERNKLLQHYKHNPNIINGIKLYSDQVLYPLKHSEPKGGNSLLLTIPNVLSRLEKIIPLPDKTDLTNDDAIYRFDLSL